MSRRKPINLLAVALAVPLAALSVAACGGGNNNNATAAPAPPKAPDGKAATIGEASTSLGKILVDAQGRTIYLFQKDSGTKSTCSGACAVAWPPVRSSGKPTVGSGLTASKVGTTPRSDGKPQVTYNGHPLYLFQEDQNAGDTNGQGVNGFGAPWYVMSPAGDAITTSAATSSASAGGGGGSSGY
jgi:predicted lipoprotein with Yx(FWY)xxD motif